MKKTRSKNIWKAGIPTALFIGMVYAALVMTNIGNNIILEPNRSWHVEAEWTPYSPLFAEGTPTGGGILEIFFVNHSATNCTENTSATVEGWCDANNLGYANADDFNTELAHSVDFDIAIKVRANKTQAWRVDKFFDTDVRVRITSSDLGINTDEVLAHKILDNDTVDDYIWLMFETKSSDNGGFSLTKDQSADITSIKFECYY